jgi:acyl-CoA synthetase (AMP-forming)/AMP-acid ligase II
MMKILFAALVVAFTIVVRTYWNVIHGIIKLLTLMVISKLHLSKHKKKYFCYCDDIEKKVDENPDKVHLIMVETGEKRTLKDTDTLANCVANWAIQKGAKQGNSAALMLLNCPDYFSIWYGLSKIGVSTALLNTNVMGKAFLHSVETALKTSDAKILIVDISLVEHLKTEIEELRSKGIQVFAWGDKQLADEIGNCSSKRPDPSLRNKTMEFDPLIFIFTSGTTGLPKACKISQTRYFNGGLLFPVLAELTEKDVLYTAMPMYHSAAGLMALAGTLRAGCCLLIRKKFSASNFSKDCLQYNVTAVQYIGELCRYLVTLPPNPLDDQVKLKCAFGNGMRREYWEKFQARYHVEHVVEFYAATEGNVGLFNCFDKVGPLGFIPKCLDFIYPLKLVKTDPDDPSLPFRNAKGNCEICLDGESGLLIAEISPERRFEGYTDQKATNAKILQSVFKDGDTYFNTGDLLSRDSDGYFYWSDRIGDTFRWKGENVSTTEVSEVMSACSSIGDVVVYGVEVPNTDGKAGMAAVVVNGKDGLNFGHLEAECNKNLPAYARPLFIRIKADGKLPVTSTHKYVKSDLVKDVS